MVMSAISDKGDQIELLRPALGAKAGDRVYLENQEISKDLPQIINAGKYKKVVGFLKTNNEKTACFNNMKLRNKVGLITVKSLINSLIS